MYMLDLLYSFTECCSSLTLNTDLEFGSNYTGCVVYILRLIKCVHLRKAP